MKNERHQPTAVNGDRGQKEIEDHVNLIHDLDRSARSGKITMDERQLIIARDIPELLEALSGRYTGMNTHMPHGQRKRRDALSEQEIAAMLRKREKGATLKELGEKYDRSPQTIRNILKAFSQMVGSTILRRSGRAS